MVVVVVVPAVIVAVEDSDHDVHLHPLRTLLQLGA